MSSPVVLASGSPRRRELLAQLGVEFTVILPAIDEAPLVGEGAVDYVARLAAEKAAAVSVPADVLVIAADTTVEIDGEIVGKPIDGDDAAAMLRRLSGRSHAVHTGVALRRSDQCLTATETSLVTFDELSDAMIAWYVGTNEPLDKAGAYAIQGAGAVLIESVSGSVSNIVGLPLPAVVRLAAELGRPLI